MVTNFCRDLGVQTKLISIIHPQANGKNESVKKVILNGLKKKPDDAKGIWVELFP